MLSVYNHWIKDGNRCSVHTDFNEHDYRKYQDSLTFLYSLLDKINFVGEIPVRIFVYCHLGNINTSKDSLDHWEQNIKCHEPSIHIDIKDETFNIRFSRFRGFKYMDSSIWNYSLNFCEIEERLGQILKEIANNYNFGIYNLAVAHEYKELQQRILRNDYLLDIDGHSGYVTPFLFHSEYEMKLKTTAIDEKDNNGQIRRSILGKKDLLHDAKWRFLLVDDHDTSGMKKKSGGITNFGKAKIIKHDIQRLLLDEEISVTYRKYTKDEKRELVIDKYDGNINHSDIIIDCVDNNEDALTLLLGPKKTENRVNEEDTSKVERIAGKARRYDVILLDYKLNGEYGYELLRTIQNECEDRDRVAGPNGTFYFMFISAYTTAVQERLQMEGFYVSKDYWFLGRGACPTNTPYLFLYCLKRMMDIRYDKLTKHSKQLLKDLKKDKDKNYKIEDYSSMSQFLTLLYQEGNERNNCVVGFNAFLNLRRVYNTVKYDIDEKEPDKGSPLIKSLFPDVVVCTNSFWEHLQNLVYLTAYGTIRQWPEMWEDYTFVKQKLEAAEKLCKDRINGEPASVLIRNYILKLKESMS